MCEKEKKSLFAEIKYEKVNTLEPIMYSYTEAANNPDGKKVSNSELYARNRALNAQRRAKLHSKG